MHAKSRGWAASGLVAVGLGVAGTAQAGLIDLGGGLIYDDVLDLTWLQDANYSKTQAGTNANLVNDIINAVGSVAGHGLQTSDFDTTTGRMTWWGAMAWADELVYAGLDDWRLPFVVDAGASGCDFGFNGTDCGYNVQTANTSTSPVTLYSELAYMYHVILALKSPYNADGIERRDWGIFGNGTSNGTDHLARPGGSHESSRHPGDAGGRPRGRPGRVSPSDRDGARHGCGRGGKRLGIPMASVSSGEVDRLNRGYAGMGTKDLAKPYTPTYSVVADSGVGVAGHLVLFGADLWPFLLPGTPGPLIHMIGAASAFAFVGTAQA